MKEFKEPTIEVIEFNTADISTGLSGIDVHAPQYD